MLLLKIFYFHIAQFITIDAIDVTDVPEIITIQLACLKRNSDVVMLLLANDPRSARSCLEEDVCPGPRGQRGPVIRRRRTTQ